MSDSLRIISLSPSATEVACALGLESFLVGISHACDFPVTITHLPRVTESLLPTVSAEQPEVVDEGEQPLPPSAEEIYLAVRAARNADELPFRIDLALVQSLAPTLILTEGGSDLYAVDDTSAATLRDTVGEAVTLLELNPTDLSDVLETFRQVGMATGRIAEAEALVRSLQDRLDAVAQKVASVATRPRTLLLSWPDPLFSSGRWLPELLTLAGATAAPWDTPGAEPHFLPGTDIQNFAPEMVVSVASSFDAEAGLFEASPLTDIPGWYDLPAVHNGDCYTINGNAYFTRFGPRLAESAEILATILHPDVFTEMLPPFAVQIFSSDLLEPEE